MPKKYTLISTAMLLAGTLGQVLPTFAETVTDTGTYYDVPELRAMYDEFIDTVTSSCGVFKNTNSFINCRLTKENQFRNTYGALYESAFKLNYVNKIALTAVNPTAGTLRFYVDYTNTFMEDAFELQNFTIFWADNTISPAIGSNSDLIWHYADQILSTGSAGDGIHVLYNSQKGNTDWLTGNAENRIVYDISGDIIANNPNQRIYFAGYDTSGAKHHRTNSFYQCVENGWDGSGECQLNYYVENNGYTSLYVTAESTAEDAALIETREKEAALRQALAEATAAATEANAAAAEAREYIAELQAALEAANNAIEVATSAAASATEEANAARQARDEALAAANIARDEATAAASSALNAAESVLAAEESRLAAEEARAIAEEARVAAEEARAAAAIARAEEAERAAAAIREAIDNANAAAAAAEAVAAEANNTLLSLETRLAELAASSQVASANTASSDGSLNNLPDLSGVTNLVGDSSEDTAAADSVVETAPLTPETGVSTGQGTINLVPVIATIFAATAAIFWFFTGKSRNSAPKSQKN